MHVPLQHVPGGEDPFQRVEFPGKPSIERHVGGHVDRSFVSLTANGPLEAIVPAMGIANSTVDPEGLPS